MARPRFQKPKLTPSARLSLRRSTAESHVYPAYKMALLDQQKRDKLKAKWSGNLSPSGFSFDMCMETYFAKVGAYLEFGLKGLMKVSIGQGMHSYLARLFKYYHSYLAPAPVVENDPEDPEKRKRQWPEVIFHYPKYHVRGKADMVPMIRRAPAIIDFKTTWLDDDLWDAFLQDPIVKNGWLCQISTYAYIGNENKYYDIPIARVGITAINLKRDPDKDDAWKEIYWDYDDKLHNRVHQLFQALLVGYQCKEKNVPVVCTNEECAKHSKSAIWYPEIARRDPRRPQEPLLPDKEIHSTKGTVIKTCLSD